MNMMTLAEVMYDSRLRDAVPVYSGTTVAGFEPVNATDWRDFSLFMPSAGTTELAVTSAAGGPLSCAVVWGVLLTGGSIVNVIIQYESAPAVFTTLATITSPAALSPSKPIVASFSAVTLAPGRQVKVIFTTVAGTVYFRQICVGAPLSFPIGQWAGVTPASLQQGVAVDNVISVNGSIIARNYRRSVKSMSIDLEYLQPTWVRTSWDPFARHMTRYACFYRWSPLGYPTEVAFAAADEIQAPVNQRPPPLMSVSMPLRVISDA